MLVCTFMQSFSLHLWAQFKVFILNSLQKIKLFLTFVYFLHNIFVLKYPLIDN